MAKSGQMNLDMGVKPLKMTIVVKGLQMIRFNANAQLVKYI